MALPPLDGHTYIRPAIFSLITRMRIVHTTQGSRVMLHAVGSPCVLCSFTMIILELESSS